MSSADDWFSDFGGQSARAGGQYFAPGTYLVTVRSIQRRTSTRPETRGHKLVVAEFDIAQVLVEYPADPGMHPAGEVLPDGTPKGHPQGGWEASNQIGSRIAWIQNPTKFGDTAYSNIKGLLLAVFQTKRPGMAESDFTPEQWREALVKATNPPGDMFAGVQLKVIVGKTRSKAGRALGTATFEPAPA